MSTTNFAEFLSHRRRGVILGALASVAHGTAAADDVLQRYLLSIAMRTPLDDVQADLRWLAERGLVAVGSAGRHLTGEITPRGREVVERLVTVAGVDVTDMPGA